MLLARWGQWTEEVLAFLKSCDRMCTIQKKKNDRGERLFLYPVPSARLPDLAPRAAPAVIYAPADVVKPKAPPVPRPPLSYPDLVAKEFAEVLQGLDHTAEIDYPSLVKRVRSKVCPPPT